VPLSATPPRFTARDCQIDLDAYAQKHGLEPVEEEPEQEQLTLFV